MTTQMKVSKSIKRYWARTGPNSVFGHDWKDRRNFSDYDAEARFNLVWKDTLRGAIRAAQKISAADANAKIPADGRQDYFDASQEHREFQLCGTTLLAQIDIGKNCLTQLWHLNEKAESREGSNPSSFPSTDIPVTTCGPAPSTPVTGRGEALAWLADRTGLPKAELAAVFAAALAETLVGME
ncbi:MAG: hypothetical protein KDN18_10985 [Verrucomicrobiae bacterium]|nr:hypothetical protein [Verrucomicrobiae bacterium]